MPSAKRPPANSMPFSLGALPGVLGPPRLSVCPAATDAAAGTLALGVVARGARAALALPAGSGPRPGAGFGVAGARDDPGQVARSAAMLPAFW